MSEFRWILLGLAVLVFIGTLIYSRMTQNKQGQDLFDRNGFGKDSFDKDVLFADDPLEIEEDFGVSEVRIITPSGQAAENSASRMEQQKSFDPDTADSMDSTRVDFPDSEDAELNSAEDESQHIVALHVVSQQGESFKGSKVCKVLEHLGLRHGKYKIYHRESLQNPDISLFSVANMVKPGYFDPQTADSFTTPGLSFFLVLPGPPDPVTTFNEMVQTAKQVAQTLNGELLDADRSSFSGQRAQLIQDEIVEFMQRHGEN